MSDAETQPEETTRNFTVTAAALGAGVVALLVVGVVTLFSIGDDGDGGADNVSIGTAAEQPAPTFDASIGNDSSAAPAGDGDGNRDISITDEPIVIDADGNIVAPDADADAEPDTEVDADEGSGDIALPDNVYTGIPLNGIPPATDVASESDDGGGLDLLGGDSAEDRRMPDLICRGLQAAQDEIQDRGVFGSKSEDATGEGRRQFWDRNWVVVGQDPEPGEPIGEFDAVLYVVKQSDDENPC